MTKQLTKQFADDIVIYLNGTGRQLMQSHPCNSTTLYNLATLADLASQLTAIVTDNTLPPAITTWLTTKPQQSIACQLSNYLFSLCEPYVLTTNSIDGTALLKDFNDYLADETAD